MLECAYTNKGFVNCIFILARNYIGFVVDMDLLCSVSEASWFILARNYIGFGVDMEWIGHGISRLDPCYKNKISVNS